MPALQVGSTSMQPAAMSGQPFNSTQHAWPSLPAPLGTTSTTASGIITTPARADTEAVDHTVQEDVLPVQVTKPEEEVHAEVVSKELYTSSTHQSTKSRKRNKFRRSDVHYSSIIWDVGDTPSGTMLS